MNRVAAYMVLAVWLLTPMGTFAASVSASPAKPACSCPIHVPVREQPGEHAHHAHGEHAGMAKGAFQTPHSPQHNHVHKLPAGPAYAPCDEHAQAAFAVSVFLPGKPLVFSTIRWMESTIAPRPMAWLCTANAAPETPPPRTA